MITFHRILLLLLIRSSICTSVAFLPQLAPDARRHIDLLRTTAQGKSVLLWKSPAVADLFFDGLSNAVNITTVTGLPSFSSSLSLTIKVLDELEAKLDGEDRDACSIVVRAFGDMLTALTTIAPQANQNLLGTTMAAAENLIRKGISLFGLGQMENQGSSGKDEILLKLIDAITSRLKNLKEGDVCLVPGGWTRPQGPDHVLIFVVRREPKSRGTFTLAVCNCGEGADRHPAAPSLAAAEATRRMVCLPIAGIPADLLQDGASWFFLLRQLVFPSVSNGPADLYDRILPALSSASVAPPNPPSVDSGDWRDLPLFSDPSHAHNLFGPALRCALRFTGLSPARASLIALRALQTLSGLAMLSPPEATLAAFPDRPQEANMLAVATAGRGVMAALQSSSLREMARSLARRALEEGLDAGAVAAVEDPAGSRDEVESLTAGPAAVIGVAGLSAVVQTCSNLSQAADIVDRSASAAATAALVKSLPRAWRAPGRTSGGLWGWRAVGPEYPLAGALRTDGLDLQALAAGSGSAALLRAVDMAGASRPPSSLQDAVHSLRQAVDACTLLANQAEQIRNSYSICFAFIVDLFTNVLPVPRPPPAPPNISESEIDLKSTADVRCFWAKSDGQMLHETQVDILHSLALLSRHLVTSSLSLRTTREIDASRSLTAACIAAIADAVISIHPIDVPSQLSLHYSGGAGGPKTPFGLDQGGFASQSEHFLLPDPAQALARADVLAYFAARERWVPPAHRLFSFSKSDGPGEGDVTFIRQICAALGFKTTDSAPRDAAAYISGAWPELLDYFPQLSFVRDISMYFHLLICPAADSLPQLRRWKPREAALTWSCDPPAPAEGTNTVDGGPLGMIFGNNGGNARLVVQGFGRRLSAVDPTTQQNIFGRLLQGRPRPRAPACGADPEGLVGSGVRTEDDVLHVPNEKLRAGLGPRLSITDAEVFCQLLTAPYLRIPLLLDWLRDENRLRALESPEVRRAVDACLFEPGPWCAAATLRLPETIPSSDAALSAAPCGLLLHELVHSPAGVMQAIPDILERALDLDTGSLQGPSAQAILFAIRLAVRVEEFLSQVIECQHHVCNISSKHCRYPSLENLVRAVGSWPDMSQNAVHRARKQVLSLLRGRAIGSLEVWRARIGEDKSSACEVLAYEALIFRNAEAHAEPFGEGLSAPAVRALLACQLTLTHHLEFGLEALATSRREDEATRMRAARGERLQFFFPMIQKQRLRLLDWIEHGPRDEVGGAVDGAVAVALRGAPLGGAVRADARAWVAEWGPSRRGKICPDTEADEVVAGVIQAGQNRQTFEGWLRAVTGVTAATEVDVQLGTLAPLCVDREEVSQRFLSTPEYEVVFGPPPTPPSPAVQCVRVMKTGECERVRLMVRHDLIYWEKDKRSPRMAMRRALAGVPDWVQQGIRRLPFQIDAGAVRFEEASGGDVFRAQVVHRSRNLLELAFFRTFDGTHVHVFKVESYSRRWLRRLIFSSSPILCMTDLTPSLTVPRDGGGYEIWCGLDNLSDGNQDEGSDGEGLVVTRALSQKMGTQVFVPSRFLNGIIPSALLDDYIFWQNADDSLFGYKTAAAVVRNKRASLTMLEVTMSNSGDCDRSGFCNAAAAIRIERIAARSTGEGVCAVVHEEIGSAESFVLLDLVHAPEGGPLSVLAQIFGAVESLGHVLAWSRLKNRDATIIEKRNNGDSAEELGADLVELPRLGVSFEGLWEDGVQRMYCREHEGLFLARQVCPLTARLLAGLPSALLLTNAANELYVLVGAGARPFLSIIPEAFPGVILLDRGDAVWRSRMAVPYYLYPVHISRRFLLFPSLSSMLYILAIRLLGRQYAEACEMAASCVSDSKLTDEESQMWNLLGQAHHDPHPDAAACRLRISLATADARRNMPLPWSEIDDYLHYVSRLSLISADCRLRPEDEEPLLQLISDSSVVATQQAAAHRRAVLRAARRSENEPPLPIETSVMMQHSYSVTDMDSLVDRSSCFSEASAAVSAGLVSLGTYRQPMAASGTSCVQLLNRLLDRGSGVLGSLLAGNPEQVGFPICYDLICGHLALQILPNDRPAALGIMLCRFASLPQTAPGVFLWSILREAQLNPQISSTLPQYNPPPPKEAGQQMSTDKAPSDPNETQAQDSGNLIGELIGGPAGLLQQNGLLGQLAGALRGPADRKRDTEFLRQVAAKLAEADFGGKLLWPNSKRVSGPSVPRAAVLPHGRLRRLLWGVPVTSKGADGPPCGKRKIAPFDVRKPDGSRFRLETRVLAELTGVPLTPLGLDSWLPTQAYTQQARAVGSGNEKDAESLKRFLMRFRIGDSKICKSQLAKDTLRRLARDWDNAEGQGAGSGPIELIGYSQDEVKTVLLSGGLTLARAAARLKSLRETLSALQRDDLSMAQEWIDEAIARVRHGTDPVEAGSRRGADLAAALLGLAGCAGRVQQGSLRQLSSLLLDADFQSRLKEVNPLLDSPTAAATVERLVAAAMLRINRAGLSGRCIAAAGQLLTLMQDHAANLQTAQDGDSVAAAAADVGLQSAEQASMLAELLSTRRNYCISTNDLGGRRNNAEGLEYDPRLLIFEFSANMILREAQVRLVRRFAEAADGPGGSLCHQLIMGAGKTTVIAPLLALFLASNQRLVVQVVPGPLLEMTRAVMRAAFSSLILRPVLTLRFDRRDDLAAAQLAASLSRARARRAIVVADPASVKSLLLKPVELLEMDEEATRGPAALLAGGQVGGGLWLEQLREVGDTVEAKLMGIRGSWEDAVTRVWQTDLERLGLRPYREDPEWNRLTDSRGRRLFGTRKTLLGGLWLKFVRPPRWGPLRGSTGHGGEALRVQLAAAREALEILKDGVLLLDEVDLLLHPLRSELNWPLGPKEPLALTLPPPTPKDGPVKGTAKVFDDVGDLEGGAGDLGLRWRFTNHLVDAFLYCTEMRTTVDYSDHAVARRILRELAETAVQGASSGALQTSPHLVLLDKAFYDTQLLPLLARWALLWLQDKGVAGPSQANLLAYLEKGAAAGSDVVDDVRSRCGGHDDGEVGMRLLNLARSLLSSVLPHVLSKVHRVSYGLLGEEHLISASNVDWDEASVGAADSNSKSSTPPSRLLLAVPFVGKDVPSAQSEFSHPDVALLLTALAYRRQGLRRPDFTSLLRALQAHLSEEAGKMVDRPTSRRWRLWVYLAGGRVRGCPPGPESVGASESDTRISPPLSDTAVAGNALRTTITGSESSGGHLNPASAAIKAANTARKEKLAAAHVNEDLLGSLWPLHLINPEDSEQVEALFAVLGALPQVVAWHLHNQVFPVTMRFQSRRLSASAQELGGDLAFGRRLGFSGTPSDLLPVEMGRCRFEEGDDGRVLRALTRPTVISTVCLERGWTALSVLHRVAVAAAKGDFHALIDAGALITGLDNLAVARVVLQEAVDSGGSLEACIFFDERNRQVALLRAGMVVVPMSQCGVPPRRRFTFFDQTHATGANVPQHPSARAALTLGKDMTFRDLAQGAYRMRGIGKGQTVTLFIPPEVDRMIRSELCSVTTTSKSSPFENEGYLCDVAGWLLLNGLRSEAVQSAMLASQRAANVWKKRSFRNLLSGADAQPVLNIPPRPALLRAWAEPAECGAVPAGVPKPLPLRVIIETRAEDMRALGLLDNPADRDALAAILKAEFGDAEVGNHAPDASIALEGEQVQEQEEEQEQEQEQEIEMEVEKEESRAEAAAARQSYSRDDEAPRPFLLAALAKSPPDATAVGAFVYPVSQFAVRTGGGLLPFGGSSSPMLPFPPFLMASRNFYDPAWGRKGGPRRLKNALVMLEWVPDIKQLTAAEEVVDLGKGASEELEVIFQLLDLDGSGSLEANEALHLLRAVDVDLGVTEEAKANHARLLQMLDRDGSKSVDREELKAAIRSRPFYLLERGRYFVLVSLREAQDLRAAMHAARRRGRSCPAPHRSGTDGAREVSPLLTACEVGSGAALGLRVLPTGWLLDATDGLPPPPGPHQLLRAVELARFFDGAVDFGPRGLAELGRALGTAPAADRARFFQAVRACRRRAPVVVEASPVSRFLGDSGDAAGLGELRRRAAATRIRLALARRGLGVADGFAAMDRDRRGSLSSAELDCGMRWLGVPLPASELSWLVAAFDADGSGEITLREFRAALKVPGLDDEDLDALAAEGLTATSAPNGTAGARIPGVIDMMPPDAEAEVAAAYRVPLETLRRMRLAVVPAAGGMSAGLGCVWAWAGEGAEEASVWSLDLSPQAGLAAALWGNRDRRVPLGHYAAVGRGRPPSDVPGGKAGAAAAAPGGPCATLELRDRGVLRDSPHAAAVLDCLAPHPRRFRLVLRGPPAPAPGGGKGGTVLHVWEMEPPDRRFVALGMVATAGSDPPPLTSARCVPASWCEPVRGTVEALGYQRGDLERVWLDRQGGAGSLWRVRQTGLLLASPKSAAAPAGALRLRGRLAGEVGGAGTESGLADVTPPSLLAELFNLT